MWRCITFLDSFKRGKRIISREQTIRTFIKIFENTENLNIPSSSDPKEAIQLGELQPFLDRQNLFRKIFIPSLCAGKLDFDRHLAGVAFVEYDPILDSTVASFCFEEKKIFKSSPVQDFYVEKIIQSVLMVEEDKKLRIGDVVEVTDGDYKGIIGRIENIEGESCVINVQIFGCDKALNLQIDQVKITEN